MNHNLRGVLVALAIVGLFAWFFSAIDSTKSGYLPSEVSYVDVSRSTGGGIDSRGRTGVVITLTNNSNKTLVSGSYSISSVDVSGRVLSSGVLTKNIRPGGSQTATGLDEVAGKRKTSKPIIKAKFR